MTDTRLVFTPNYEKIKLSAALQKDVDEWLEWSHNKITELPLNVHAGNELGSGYSPHPSQS